MLAHRITSFKDNVVLPSCRALPTTAMANKVTSITRHGMPTRNTGSLAPSGSMLTEISDVLLVGRMVTKLFNRRSKPKHAPSRVFKKTRNITLHTATDYASSSLHGFVTEPNFGLIFFRDTRDAKKEFVGPDGTP